MGGKSSDPNKGARQAEAARLARIAGVPEAELEEYILQNPDIAGLMESEQLNNSGMEDIQLDPQMRDAQMSALAGLSERADQGLTAQDKYAAEEMIGQVGAQEKSSRAAIESEMQRKGMGDSGASLMAKLQGAQGGANQGRKQAMQMIAQGQNQRMNADQMRGQMAGNMQNDDFNRQSQIKKAGDAIAKANAMNRQSVAGQNLAIRQSHENQRANTANQQAQVKNQIEQQKFNNSMAKAGSANSIASTPDAPQGPSGFQKLATVGGGIAGAYFGGPAGAGAGASAGSAMGSMFEDGGIAQAEIKHKASAHKQHEKFKKDYMKRVHSELSPQEEAAQEVTGQLSAQDGAVVHAKNGYPDENQFQLDTPTFAPISYQDSAAPMELKKPSMLGPVPTERDVVAEAVNKTQLAPDEKLRPEDDSKAMEGIGAIGDIAKLMSAKGKAPAPIKNTFKLQNSENVMKPIGPTEYANTMRGFEDGGTPCYASDGMGDIVDSGMESYADDRIDAKINDGEAILNVPQQQRMMDLIRGDIDTDELGDEDIVEGVPRSFRDEMHEDLEEGKESNKVAGLKKLLEALGE